MDYELIFLKLPAKNIVLIKFLLESYEGLCILRTLNSERGEVVIIALPDTIDTVREVLNDLQPTIGFRTIPQPSQLEEDWLLQEFFTPAAKSDSP
jgi:hypothetical protein